MIGVFEGCNYILFYGILWAARCYFIPAIYLIFILFEVNFLYTVPRLIFIDGPHF